MGALSDIVRSGKALYVGIPKYPAAQTRAQAPQQTQSPSLTVVETLSAIQDSFPRFLTPVPFTLNILSPPR